MEILDGAGLADVTSRKTEPLRAMLAAAFMLESDQSAAQARDHVGPR